MFSERDFNLLRFLTESGMEWSMGYFPSEAWPNEGTPTPEGERYHLYTCAFPGTDMLCSIYKGANFAECIQKFREDADNPKWKEALAAAGG